MDIGSSVTSDDGVLKVSLEDFDPSRGKGHIQIHELRQERGRFYVKVKFGSGGEFAVDYRMGDVERKRTPVFEISTSVRNDTVDAIHLTRLDQGVGWRHAH